MSRRKKKRKQPRPPSTVSAGARSPGGGAPAGSLPAGKLRRIESLMAAGKHREAVTRAKRLHARLGTPASEGLLVDVYVARIKGLLQAGMRSEARALLQMVWGRLPGSRERLASLRVQVGMLEELLAPLMEPDLTTARREEILTLVRRQVRDLDELAGCQALPEDHRLRRDARALSEAFAAVTSREVSDSEVALEAVSRRSPLAPWKMLVRALACFYGRQDARAQRWLDAIELEAAVRPLADVLGGLLDGDAPVPPAASALVDALSGSSAALRGRLQRLEDALERNAPRKAILEAMQRAIETCQQIRPELTTRLRQHLSIRAVRHGLPAQAVRRALGAPSRKDAYFWRLWAISEERQHGVPSLALACELWDRFLCHAVAEGWFEAGSVEEATVYLHMAQLLAQLPPSAVEELRYETQPDAFAGAYKEQPAEIQEAGAAGADRPALYFLDPAYLYERACAAHPTAERFRAWLRWSRHAGESPKGLDLVVQRWHDAIPADSGPLLLLYASAERRRAFKKALAYVREAEAIDGLNPEIRRARARLQVATVVRHVSQGKPHLVDKDLLALDGELAGRADLPALVPAFRCAWRVLRQEPDHAQEEAGRTEALLGSRQTSVVVLKAVFEAGLLPEASFKAVTKGLGRFVVGGTPDAIRALTLVREVALTVTLPSGWYRGMSADLRQRRCALTADQLRALAEAALDAGELKLAYLAAGVGLGLPEADVARSLLLRARSLPVFAAARQQECLAAVVELARQRQDVGLLEEAGQVQRERPGYLDDWGPASAAEDGVLWPDVVRFERSQRQYPTFNDVAPFWASEEDACNCPACRRRRGEIGPGRRGRRSVPPPQLDLGWLDDDELDELDELDEWDELDELDDELLGALDDELDDGEREELGALLGAAGGVPGMSLEALPLLQEVAARFGRLPDPEELERLDPELFQRMVELVGSVVPGLKEAMDRPDLTGPPKRRKPRGGRKRRR